jgi:hypothetical protein
LYEYVYGVVSYIPLMYPMRHMWQQLPAQEQEELLESRVDHAPILVNVDANGSSGCSGCVASQASMVAKRQQQMLWLRLLSE